jgi:hypothetical protein
LEKTHSVYGQQTNSCIFRRYKTSKVRVKLFDIIPVSISLLQIDLDVDKKPDEI